MKTLREAAAALLDAVFEYLIVVPEGPVARMRNLKPVLDAHETLRAALDTPDAEKALEELVKFGVVSTTPIGDLLTGCSDDFLNWSEWLKSRGAE